MIRCYPAFMSRFSLPLLLLAFLVLGAALIARVPLNASPDEAAHWQYIQFLVANRALPVFTPAMVPPAPGYEFHQPPLYYALVAPAWAVLPPGFQNYWARAVSLLCGLATLIFIWKTALLAFPEERSIAVLATGLAALWPLHLGVSAGANNDALAGLWAAALFWVGTRALVLGASGRDAVWTGVFIGLGALTKNTVLVVALAALGALWVTPNPARDESAVESAVRALSPAIRVLAALAILVAVAGPWWARNTLLYGDPLALGAFSQAASAGTPGFPQFSQAGIDLFTYWRGMIWLIFLTCWGFFGGSTTAARLTAPLNFDGPIVHDSRLLPLMAICLLAPLACFAGWRRLDFPLEASQKRVLWFFAAGFGLVALAWMQFAYAHFSGGQARYLHAALLPMCIALALGWRGMWGEGRALKIASLAMGAVLVALTLLNVLGWQTLV